MNESKQFLKLSKSAKKILTDYEDDEDKAELFKSIKANVKSQKTIASKTVRRSTFRGLLRKWFNFTDKEMLKIESSKKEKQAYFDTKVYSISLQKINIVDSELIEKMMMSDIINLLLMTSGLRIQELTMNKSKFVDNIIYFKIDKKIVSEYYKIYPIIENSRWWTIYESMKQENVKRNVNAIIATVNRKLKPIIPSDFYKRSSHINRGIYVNFYIKFLNNDNLPPPQLTMKILNHGNTNSSAHYQYIQLADDVKSDIFDQYDYI